MSGKPAFGPLELLRCVGSFDKTEQPRQRAAPFLFQRCRQLLLRLLVLAEPDQRRKIRFEQLEVAAQIARHLLPGRLQRVAIFRAVEIFAIHTDGPLADRVAGDTSLCLQARQQLREVVPVLEPVVERAEQAEGVAVVA